MTIKQIQLANTFDVWRVATNDLIVVANDLVEGNLQTTGTVSLTNPSGFQNNVSLNVRSGMIYGDAGLLSNVGKPGSIVNNKLQNNSITINSTSGQVLLSASVISLGDTLYLNVTNLVTSVNDTSVSNIASANLVNVTHRIATFANTAVAASYNRTNAVSDSVNSAYVLANTINSIALSALSDIANNFISDTKIFDAANAAFDKANVAVANVNYVNTAAIAAFSTANVAIANVNYVNTAVIAAFARANIAIANVNYANTLAQNAQANATYANTGMIAAFAKANAALANSTGTFAGSLTTTGIIADQYGNVRLQFSSTPADTNRVLGKNDIANLVIMGTNTNATLSNTYVPENVFSPGDSITLYNNTSTAQTVRPNIAVVRVMLAGSATANSMVGATRNVTANGIATLYCVAANTFVLTGTGAIE